MIRGMQLQFKGIKTDADQWDMGLPRAASMTARLDGVSEFRLDYSEVQMPTFLSQKDSLAFPHELRVLVLHESDNRKTERCLFRGPLTRFQHVSHTGKDLLRFQFSDPMVVAQERDKTMIWSGEGLPSIVDSLFVGAYKGNGADIVSRFEGDGIPQPKSISNMDKDNLRFITEDIAAKYGYRFYFDHSLKDENQIRFFRPKIQPDGPTRLAGSLFEPLNYTYTSDFNHTASSIHVHGSGGSTTTVTAQQFASGLSSGSLARMDVRSQNKMNLQMNWAMPNAGDKEAESIAQALWMKGAWNSDSIEFATDAYFDLGEYVLLESDETILPAYLEGSFLISAVERVFSGGRSPWKNHYVGVRA